MKAKLIVVGGTNSMTEVNLRLPAIIGRGRSAEVTIPHALVSRQHCEISEAAGRLCVRDLNSLNGTYVGDERITEAVLEPGALLTVGTVTFRAVYEVGVGDVREEALLDTCRCEPSLSDTADGCDAVSPRTADDETIPVDANSLVEALLPPRVVDSGDASKGATAERTLDHSD